MIIQKFKKGPLGNNNYVVIDEASHEAAIVDCSQNPQDMFDFIQQNGAQLKYILLTHGHFDHIIGLNELTIEEKVYLNHQDKDLLDHINYFMDFVGLPHTKAPKIGVFFDETTPLNLGKTKIKIIHTPGHTEGCVCFLIQNYLFSGDTIFKQTHGRTDLMGGDSKKMCDSLKKLLQLPEETIILPGHGTQTTIGQERQFYNSKKIS